ncbi:uncharacterized protein PV06_09299 [Exophiala oligosperma]|uniref:Palmitoyltransferase n=1 Tax=Exophiala oligosperma TaxID=215243 RepID=A0A0D2D7E0_9EURO|nr:uncharacterized protein PV06_09299 [Exophiala oligosperma]KIW38325.1 hypothetical protein PV06_09299 [Exophiala oligosperma]
MKKINGMRPGENNKRGNIITARIVPILLLGIIGYSSYVVTEKICVDYLLSRPGTRSSSSPSFTHKQTGAAVAILTIYYLLLLITLICFARLIQTITFNAGLVPRGAQYFVERERAHRESQRSHKEEAVDPDGKEGYTPRRFRHKRDSGHAAQNFWHKDVFVCGWDGRPPFCSTCYNYKPDRAHHCSELGRCVLKMDHFCPWVGGIVSETSFKFFIQFTFWAALFCLHTLIFVSYFFAQRRSRQPGGFFNVHWVLALIFAALFFVFSAGMCGSSLQFAFLNSSTIENFTRKTKVWYLAVHVPRHVVERYHASGRDDLRLISYPRPASEQFEILEQSGATLGETEREMARRDTLPGAPQAAYHHPQVSDRSPNSNPTTEEQLRAGGGSVSSSPTAVPETRTFAILETLPGGNPFDIGPYGNFKEVMGYSVFDWLFPARLSPLVDHSDPTGMYKMGKVVESLKSQARILDSSPQDSRDVEGPFSTSEGENEKAESRHVKRHKRKKRRLSTT